MRTIFIALTLTLAIPAASAQAQSAFDPAARAATIAPLIDAAAVGVLHVDLDRVDSKALLDEAGKVTPKWTADLKPILDPMMVDLQVLKAAGCREVYATISLHNMVAGDLIAIAIPMPSGSDAKVVPPLVPMAGLDTAERIGGLVVCGKAETLKRVRMLPPDPRPELKTAFEAAGDTAFQAILLPPKHTERVFQELMPTLPGELGGGPSTVLTRGMRWVAVGLDLPPKLGARLVIQSQDAAAADAFRAKWDEVVALAGKDKCVQEKLPKFDDLVRLLAPRAQGDRLVVTLDRESRGVERLLMCLDGQNR